MPERILVTGGAGMIGSNLVKTLVDQGHDVAVVDNLWRGRLEYLAAPHGGHVIDLERRFHRLDLSEAGVLDELIRGFDFVYHLADVVAGIDYVFANQGSVFRQNILINSNVVASARAAADTLKGFVYVGTACSFPAHLQSGPDARPLKEEDQYPAAPESGYGWSKLMGEYEALLMEQEVGVPVSVLSLHNVYGSPCAFDAKTGQVIPSLIRKAISFPDEDFIVWGSGAQGRAFVHVDDVVAALVSTRERGMGKGLVQIGPDTCTTIGQIAEAVVEISGKDITIQYDRTKPEGDRGRCADYTRAREVLGWNPTVSLHDGLTELYRWIEAEMAADAPPNRSSEAG